MYSGVPQTMPAVGASDSPLAGLGILHQLRDAEVEHDRELTVRAQLLYEEFSA